MRQVRRGQVSHEESGRIAALLFSVVVHIFPGNIYVHLLHVLYLVNGFGMVMGDG